MNSPLDDFLLQRTQLWKRIDELLAKRNLFAAREAQQLLIRWMEEHPEDSYSQVGGEEVAMSVEAWEIIEGETASSRTDQFYTQRAQLWEVIDSLLGQADLAKACEAQQMLQEWLRQHPDDSYSQEAGVLITSMKNTLVALPYKKAAEPIAA